MVSVFGAIRLLELGLKVFVFKDSDRFEYAKPYPEVPGAVKVSSDEAKVAEAEQKEIQERETKRQRQRETAGALSMIFIGFPLYKYHWKIIQKEDKSDSKQK